MKRWLPFLLLAAASLQGAAAAPPPPPAPTPEPYFARLAAEFKPIGTARFIGGTDEAETLAGFQAGGGVEKFFPSADQAPSLILGEVAAVEGQPFTKSRQLTVAAKPKVYWDAQFRLPSRAAAKKGESLLLVFWARGKKAPQIVDDGAGAALQAYVRARIGNLPKNRASNFYDCKMLTEKWERHYIKTGPLPQDFPAGTLELVGMVGHKEQAVEIGGLAWMAFPEGAALDQMPKRSWDYAGRAPDAPWRREAQRRIESCRKGPLAIEVVDAAGKPVPGAAVAVRMKQHAFHFGTAISVAAFAGKQRGMTPEDVASYKEISSRHYNAIVLENELKWTYFEGGRQDGWRETKGCLQFYHGQGKRIRGHVLVWPTVHRLPKALKEKVTAEPGRLGEMVRNHIIEEVSAFKPWIHDWDVTNETDVNRDFMDTLGPEAMAGWYRTARAAAPEAMLTFNEPAFGPAGMEIGSFPERLLTSQCRGWVDYLIQQGAPLDALGAQAHGAPVGKEFAGKTGPEGLWAYFDHLAERYGKKLQYTELDVAIGDSTDPDQLAYQADLLRDSMTVAFAHPAFIAITQWGFWEGAHHAPSAALWTRDWQLKPNGKAYLDLVFKQWWTKADLTTSAEGRCTLRAFYGDYEIRATAGGKEQTVTCRFAPGTAAPVRLRLD
ncbi:MAG: endo-1,4-beta-xylanase [Lentisphaeria bacterium]|jgi:GH35 family endo-1,4-beta-xylanase